MKEVPVFVYTYHRILPKKGHDIGLKLFEFHLKVFRNFFEVLDWEHFKAYLQGEYKPKRRAAFLTFDDGYVDNFVYAYPLLKKYRLKAHIFVTPSRVLNKPLVRPTLKDYWEGKVPLKDLIKPKPMWEAQSEFLIKGESEEFLSWEELNLMKDVFTFGSHGMSHTQGFVSDRLVDFVDDKNINRIYSLWKIYNPPSAGFPIFEMKSDLTAPIGTVKAEVLEFCEQFPKRGNWKENLNRELLKNFKHPLEFETFEGYQKRVEEDLKLSKEILEKNLGVEIDSFSYPWGHYSDRLFPMVGKFYKFAFTVEKGKVKPNSDRFLIPRVYAVKDVFTFLGHLWRFGR